MNLLGGRASEDMNVVASETVFVDDFSFAVAVHIIFIALAILLVYGPAAVVETYCKNSSFLRICKGSEFFFKWEGF